MPEYSAFPERSGYGKGQPFMDCPKTGKRLVVPFLFEWETLKLVTPDVFELLHVGQHLNVPVSRIIETGRDGGCLPSSSGRFPHGILKSQVGYICSFP